VLGHGERGGSDRCERQDERVPPLGPAACRAVAVPGRGRDPWIAEAVEHGARCQIRRRAGRELLLERVVQMGRDLVDEAPPGAAGPA
jgi:hypothetical protein